MVRLSLRILNGLSLFCAVVSLLLDSNVLALLEGENPDGSSSLTWHTGLLAVLLISICQVISFWLFRRRVALTVLLGAAACVVCWRWLAWSGLGFAWEPRNSEGTYPLTWRSAIVVIAFLLTFLASAFLIRWAISLLRRRNVAPG